MKSVNMFQNIHRSRLTDTGVDKNHKSTEMFNLGTKLNVQTWL